MPVSQSSARSHTRLVVVGAEFDGLAVVRALGGADVDVTLIDRTHHHLFQPLLHRVATAALSPAEIATANRVLLRRYKNVSIVMGEVIGVDVESQHVKLRATEDYPYDYLVLAPGADYSYFGNNRWSQHSWVLKIRGDATKIRDRVLGALESAETRVGPAEVRRLLTFVVVGGAVKVGETYRAPHMPNVFAIVDVSRQLDAHGRPLPGLGAVAQQHGTYVGKLSRATVEGKPFAVPFCYRDRGTLAVNGRYRAVAQLPRTHFTGTVAWLMWALIQLTLLMYFRSKFAVYCCWCWTWLTNNRGASMVANLSKLNETEASGSFAGAPLWKASFQP